MNGIIEDYGMIIKVMPVGDYDKRITMLTKDRGKISAFARGARRQGNMLMGVTRVFATGRFKLHEGRDAYTLQSASIDNYFDELTQDIEKTCYGMYFLELVDYYSREYLSDPGMIKLLYLTLRALGRPSLPNKLVRRIFELRLMKIGGQYYSEPSKTVSPATVYTWQFILESPMEKLFTFVVTDEVLDELSICIESMMKKYIDRRMNSLDVLETLTGK